MLPRVLCALVLVSCLVPCANGETPIFLIPQDGEVDACSDSVYCADVWISAASDIKGYSVRITFEDADLNLLCIESGDIFTGAGHECAFFDEVRAGAAEDTIAVDSSDLTGSVSGPGHLFTICFGPPWVEAFRSPIIFVAAQVRRSDNSPIDVSTTDGTVTVSHPTASDHSTWGEIKALYQ